MLYERPDHTEIDDYDNYMESWKTLCLALEIALPNIKIVSFDPDIMFEYSDKIYKIPSDIALRIVSLYYQATLQEENTKDERTKLWKDVKF
jgi:hypothetical protein